MGWLHLNRLVTSSCEMGGVVGAGGTNSSRGGSPNCVLESTKSASLKSLESEEFLNASTSRAASDKRRLLRRIIVFPFADIMTENCVAAIKALCHGWGGLDDSFAVTEGIEAVNAVANNDDGDENVSGGMFGGVGHGTKRAVV